MCNERSAIEGCLSDAVSYTHLVLLFVRQTKLLAQLRIGGSVPVVVDARHHLARLQGLTKHYKGFTLGPLDLTLPGGTICGLIGENGAGKSTTIRLILDMVQRDGGTVTILGKDSRTASVRAKEEISVVLGSEGIPLCLNADVYKRQWQSWRPGCAA